MFWSWESDLAVSWPLFLFLGLNVHELLVPYKIDIFKTSINLKLAFFIVNKIKFNYINVIHFIPLYFQKF